jgi:ligand-binding sensor domain-containing protein
MAMKRGLLILLLLLWAVRGFSLDPDVTVDKYILRHWTTKDGLPQNTVHCLVQDRQGFIWLGTENGLARFDGSYFKVFDRITTGVLKSNRISALYAEQDGTLWIRTSSGDVILYKWQRFR